MGVRLGTSPALQSSPDSVVFDSSKHANQGVQQETYQPNCEAYPSHHDPSIPVAPAYQGVP